MLVTTQVDTHRPSNRTVHKVRDNTCTGFILACVVRVKNENGPKFTRNKKIMATGRPMCFKWQHRGSVTHSTLLHMHSKLVVLGK